MRRRYRQSVNVRGGDRGRRSDFSAGALRVGQMRPADFSPTVTTMRFQPIIVPRPSAMATAIFTQLGMNLVASSSESLYALNIRTWSAESSLSLSFIKKRIASEARYMSLRTLPTVSAGIFDSALYL